MVGTGSELFDDWPEANDMAASVALTVEPSLLPRRMSKGLVVGNLLGGNLTDGALPAVNRVIRKSGG